MADRRLRPGIAGFEGGALASLACSGYAHFDSDEIDGRIGEMGMRRDAANHGAARAGLRFRREFRDDDALATPTLRVEGPCMLPPPKRTIFSAA
jgi:hypothetical protein